MTDVFVSYSHGDGAYAHRLADDMRGHGLDVWIDDRIAHGEHWFESIEQAISASRTVVVIMTPEAGKSEWVAKEILIAKRERKPIYPVLLRGREFAILIDLQFANVTGGKLPPDDFYARLGAMQAASRPKSGSKGGRGVGVVIAALALIAAGVFALAGAGGIPLFRAAPTATLPPPTFPSLDGTYMPPIDVSQIDPNAFPGPSPIPLGGQSMIPPTEGLGGAPMPDVTVTSLVDAYFSLVLENNLDGADSFVCPAKRGSLSPSLRRLMTERGIVGAGNFSCISTGGNDFTCTYTVTQTDGQLLAQTDQFHLENNLIC